MDEPIRIESRRSREVVRLNPDGTHWVAPGFVAAAKKFVAGDPFGVAKVDEWCGVQPQEVRG
jgi:hypothetical protein